MATILKAVGRTLAAGFLLAWLAVPAPLGAVAPGARLAAAPSPPAWPVPDLRDDVKSLLVQYFDQEGGTSTPYYYLAPEWETDKRPARKDPDTLWEYNTGGGSACHNASTDAQFIDCAGKRLAKTFGLVYGGGLTIFDPTKDYYANDARAHMAGYYALYHAFAHDFDAANAGAYSPTTGRAPRDAKRYHERMIRAYEAHMRDILLKTFRDKRATTPAVTPEQRDKNIQWQLDMTRAIGALESSYVRVVEAMQEYNAWASPADRKKALAIVNAMNQRIWWEWVWTQANGPRTAGLADLGSEATYQAAVASNPARAGQQQFVYGAETIPSLRPASFDSGGASGMWFDADYAVPGEWWCYGRYGAGSPERITCLAQASRESKNGTKSPFGQYYGPTSPSVNCLSRSPSQTTNSCDATNLGSIAEEWTWTFLGARAGMFLMKELAASGDADTPAGVIGPNEYAVVSARLGYGISGWNGADPFHDDLEWQYNPSAGTLAIRTLSAGRHDFELQDGRFSVGETDTSPAGSARDGDNWDENNEKQEYPGGIENHVPGPNPLYGTLLYAHVLSDKVSEPGSVDVADGLSKSFYDQYHRNQVDEFNSWIWLLQSSYYRCVGVTDPADNSCFAFSTATWPNPPTINRVPLFTRPDDISVNLRYRYLWRDAFSAVNPSYIASRESSCRSNTGLPWRHVNDFAANANAGYLLDEGGFGAYNEIIQGLGGVMRLLADRYPLKAVEQSAQAEYDVQKSDVYVPWYNDSYNQVKAILALYRNAFPTGYGYVPDIENSTCIGFDPMLPGDQTNKMVLSWQVGTGDSISATTVRRAMWYAITAMWYWWYDSTWLDVDASVW